MIALGAALLLLATPAARAAEVLLEEAPLGAAQVEAAGLTPLEAPRSLGFAGHPVWVRLRVVNAGDRPEDRMLGWEWPLVDRLDFWWRDAEGGWVRRTGGLAVPPAARQVTHAVQRHFTLLQLAPGEVRDVYARVETRGPLLLGASAFRQAEIGGLVTRTLLWFGAWLGAIAMLVAGGLLSWRLHRQPVYLQHALTTAAVGGYQAVMSGALVAIAPSLGDGVLALEPILGAAAAAFGAGFARAYVRRFGAHPWLDGLLRALAGGAGLAALPVLWGDVHLANQLTSITGAAAIGASLAACLVEAVRGNTTARHLLVGFGPFALASAWYLGMLRGLFAPAAAAPLAFQLTFLLTGLSVALALASERRLEEDRNRHHLEAAVLDQTRALEATVARLQSAQRLEVVGRLTAGVAHDFNNLLSAISSGVGDLQRELPAGAAAGPVLEEVRGLVRRGGELVRSLLMVARRQPLEPHPVDLNDLVAQLVRLLERLVKGVAIHLDLSPATGAVQADPGQLEQVVLNLVLNARDACDGRGRIVVSTRRVARTAGPGGPSSGEWVQLEVQDDGPGMDEATRARIFEPFFTTKGEGKGTGVGLSVVEGVARAHGGFVEVASAPGQGAAFTVWLPVDGAPRLGAGLTLTPPPAGALTGRAHSVT